MKTEELELQDLKKTYKNKAEEFQEQLAYGEQGELVIEEYLTFTENRVCLGMRQFSPKQAPLIGTFNGKLTSPDIITFKGNKAIFVECKRKEEWVSGWSCHDSGLETGLDAKHWKHYRELVQTTFIPLEIYFIQETMSPVGIYKITIDMNFLHYISSNPNHIRSGTIPKNGKPNRMVFFPLEILKKIK